MIHRTAIESKYLTLVPLNKKLKSNAIMLSLQKPAGQLEVITLYGWLFSIILTGIMRFKNNRSVYVLAGIIFIVLLMKKC
jgi:hypothetical protein